MKRKMSLNQLIREICELRTFDNEFDVDVAIAIYVIIKETKTEEIAFSYFRDYALFRDIGDSKNYRIKRGEKN